MRIAIGSLTGAPCWRPRIPFAWLAIVAALVLGVPSAALAQDSTPEASPAATPEAQAIQPFDLPAMVLRPEDVGDNYGIRAATFNDLDDIAARLANALGISTGEARDRLVAAGLETVYNIAFAIPSEAEGAASGARTVTTFLYLYETASGGKTGYALLGESWETSGYEAVEGTRRWGNATQIARISQTDGSAQQILALTFRVHELVAGVVIQDSTGTEPTVEEIEDLASALRRRMREVQEGGGPDLPAHTLHINPGGRFTLTTTESYDRLDGTTLRRFGESDEAFAQRDASYGAAINVYHTAHLVQRRGIEQDQPFTIVTAFTMDFDDEAAAADFVTNGVPAYLEAAGVGEARVADDPRSFGDRSSAVIYQINYGGGITATGYAYFVQIGNQVAIVQADAPRGPSISGVESLVERQVECLTGDSCRPAPVPSGLVAT